MAELVANCGNEAPLQMVFEDDQGWQELLEQVELECGDRLGEGLHSTWEEGETQSWFQSLKYHGSRSPCLRS